jgi:hypothetical protein
MTNIIVTFPQSKGGIQGLKEKIKYSQDPELETYWEFKRFPKKLEIGERIYITCNGVIQGYFIFCDIERPAWQGTTLAFLCDWTPIHTPIPYVSFQGFHYIHYPVTKELADAERKEV